MQNTVIYYVAIKASVECASTCVRKSDQGCDHNECKIFACAHFLECDNVTLYFVVPMQICTFSEELNVYILPAYLFFPFSDQLKTYMATLTW